MDNVEGKRLICLAFNTKIGVLEICTIDQQDLVMDKYDGLVPLLLIGVWENDYYVNMQKNEDFNKDMW